MRAKGECIGNDEIVQVGKELREHVRNVIANFAPNVPYDKAERLAQVMEMTFVTGLQRTAAPSNAPMKPDGSFGADFRWTW